MTDLAEILLRLGGATLIGFAIALNGLMTAACTWTTGTISGQADTDGTATGGD